MKAEVFTKAVNLRGMKSSVTFLLLESLSGYNNYSFLHTAIVDKDQTAHSV